MKNPIRALNLTCLIACCMITGSGCQSESYTERSVIRGRFIQSITETGELAAVRSEAIPSPRMDYRYGYEFKIVDMIDNGAQVRTGDTLILLDDTSIQRFIVQRQEELEKENAAATMQEVESRNAMQQLEAQLKSETAGFNLRKLSMERAEYETPKNRKLKELEFQKAQIRLNKLKRQIKMRPVMHAYDQKIAQIKVWQKQEELEGAYEALNKMVITSPADGLFQVGKSMFQYPPADLKIGDQVFMGSLIARIPDVTQMRVDTHINESDYTKVQVGSQVIVRLDALPKVPFHGRVSYINRTCTKMNENQVFKVQVMIEESDLRLKPGMTVSCEFISYAGEDDLFVPNDCIIQENGKFYVFLDKGSAPKKTEIDTGPSNSHHTIIYSTLKAGDKLIPLEELSNPEKS